MPDLLRITKKNKSLIGEYYTLRQINRMLCQEEIPLKEVSDFLLNKSAETPPFSLESDNKARKNLIHFYRTHSNGLIYQYYPIRAMLWKICLGYLHSTKNKWISHLEGKLIEYEEYVKNYIIENVIKKKTSLKKIDPPRDTSPEKFFLSPEPSSENSTKEHAPKHSSSGDHPLNKKKESKWKNFFEDNELWNTVEKDTVRTRPNCKFFQEEFEIELSMEDFKKKY